MDELVAPRLNLADVGVVENDPAHPPPAASAPVAQGVPSAPSDRPAAPPMEPPPAVPSYVDDFRVLLNRDYEPRSSIDVMPTLGGTLPDRMEKLRRTTTDVPSYERITHEPDAAVGGVLDSQAGPIHCVSAEVYFATLLSTRVDAAKVFLAAYLSERITPAELMAVDDAIARAYWDTYLGCLMPRHVLALVAAADALPPTAPGDIGGSRTPPASILALLERTRIALFAAASFDGTLDLYATARADLLIRGASGVLTERQVTVGEAVSDLLLLQRSIAFDVSRAESERAPGTPRAEVLDRLDRDDDMFFYQGLGIVQDPVRVWSRIPAHHRVIVARYLKARPLVSGPRVFSSGADTDVAAAPATLAGA
jgi:hypothetical protein